jgi:hypothetical protein
VQNGPLERDRSAARGDHELGGLMASFTVTATVAAPIDTVFDVLTDHRGYADITPLRAVTLERQGHPEPDGVGAVRVLKLLGPPIREEVTVYERPSRFSYRMLSGAPVSEHIGTVDLTADGNRTQIAYRVDTTPSIPVPESAWAAANKPVINRLLGAIVKEAERRGRAV